MAIGDLPTTYVEFERLMDTYKTAHLAYDADGRAIADSTMALMATFQPRAAQWAMNVLARQRPAPPGQGGAGRLGRG